MNTDSHGWLRFFYSTVYAVEYYITEPVLPNEQELAKTVSHVTCTNCILHIHAWSEAIHELNKSWEYG